ncbi:MAG TPA: AgmX/PglI C-terminal domain-containing protein [Candidatus Nanopelagicales bacterium]|nr:AgmX/PglI C-terminal domain-containing protein [Candidatus Nanopelagicales bacterium]
MLRVLRVAPLLILLGCGAPPPPPPPPPTTPPPPPERTDPGPVEMRSEIGGLPEEAMNRAFRSLDGPIQACFDEATGRNPALGGRFTLKMRIGSDGRPRWAYLSETDLGDRTLERCVLDLARDKQWPKPLGGDGLAERSYEIDARSPVKELEEKWVKPAVAKARTNAWKCRKGKLRGRVRATVHIAPNGKVLGASITPPDERFEEVADCVAEEIGKIRFGKVGRRMKLTFEIFW